MLFQFTTIKRETKLVDKEDKNPTIAPTLMKFQRGCHQVSPSGFKTISLFPFVYSWCTFTLAWSKSNSVHASSLSARAYHVLHVSYLIKVISGAYEKWAYMISALSPFYRGQLSVSSIGYKSENNIKDNQKYEVWVHQSAHMYMSQDPIFKAGKWLRIAGCHCHHTDGRVYINHIRLTWQYTRWMIDSMSLSPCVCITYWRSHLGLYWLSQSVLVLLPLVLV